ncbi:hypothetical protein N7522_005154 [Penicillium canescens]|nr:hypothetical protein N7522_005154 [Penicillium canescens]
MERRRNKYTSLDEDVMNQSILHIEDIEGITTDIDDKPLAQGGDRSDNVLIDAFKLYDMKRDHYGLAEEYISDYQRQMNILRRSKIAPPAFISIGIMIRELQDKLPDMAFTREALRKVKESHEITHEDFDKQCKEMTIKARQLAVKANKTHSARRNPFRTDRQDKNTTVVAEPSNQNNQNEAPECDWVLSSAVWSLSSAIHDRNEKQGRVSLAIQTYMAESPTTLPTPKATELAIEELNPKPVGKPSLTHLRPWGCIAYVHIPKSKRVQSRKLASRAIKGHLMGYVGDHGH